MPLNVDGAVRLNTPLIVTVTGFEVVHPGPARFTSVPRGDTFVIRMWNVEVVVTDRVAKSTWPEIGRARWRRSRQPAAPRRGA